MTLITFQDGKPVMRDGQVGTEQACCCGCPSGCPALQGCNLVVIRDFIAAGGDTNITDHDAPASGFEINEYSECQLQFTVADNPSEYGGEITGLLTIGYDANCCPVIKNTEITYSNTENAEFLVPLDISIECDYAPCGGGLCWVCDITYLPEVEGQCPPGFSWTGVECKKLTPSSSDNYLAASSECEQAQQALGVQVCGGGVGVPCSFWEITPGIGYTPEDCPVDFP